jgi:DMSO/TMAO reductase YedYZ molybdopterin-dependent catalytic subunit
MSDRHPLITLPDEEATKELGRRSRRDFLIGGLAAVGAVGAYEWITRAKEENGVPWPQRRALEFNGKLAHGYLDNSHFMTTYSPAEVGRLKANGDIGMEEPFDKSKWRLEFASSEGERPLNLSLGDVMALPKVEMITQFCCIEGWSMVTHWGGARFADFARKYLPPGEKMPNYVYMATPGEDYYVGLDIKSAMHPQTLLAYEQDGRPLRNEHGAPLRLAIPVKYGIKNIKRIGSIRFTDEKPDDYWAEEGYDWFAGL